jgi:glycerol-3-phosphate acyltransferase PlsY
MWNYALPLVGYLIGSVSFAILVARAAGLGDPRRAGSGNPGATNILRLGSRKAAVLTLLGDLAKGTVAVLLARWFTADPVVLSLTALAVFLGHLFPVWFGFRGGKGVATALGAYLGLEPLLALAMVAIWLVMALAFRYSSLAALTATALSPLLVLWLLKAPAYLVLSLVMAALLFWRHRSNIANLVAGTEKRIGEKERPAP